MSNLNANIFPFSLFASSHSAYHDSDSVVSGGYGSDTESAAVQTISAGFRVFAHGFGHSRGGEIQVSGGRDGVAQWPLERLVYWYPAGILVMVGGGVET